jgi:hypothetical protein
MVKAKFNPDDADQEVLAAMEEETSVALAPPQAMALGSMGGDVSVSDLKFPRLQIAYGVGGLAENFTQGDLVLDKEHLLAKKGSSVRVIILNTLTYWKEYTSFNEGRMPRIFKTEQEAVKEGLTTTWSNGVPAQVKKAMDLRLLVRKPDGLTCGLFGLALGGAEWAPAIWSVDKTAYDRISEKILPVAGFALKDKGLLYGAWDISTVTEKNKKGTVVTVPVIKYAGLNDDKLVAEIRTVFGQS